MYTLASVDDEPFVATLIVWLAGIEAGLAWQSTSSFWRSVLPLRFSNLSAYLPVQCPFECCAGNNLTLLYANIDSKWNLQRCRGCSGCGNSGGCTLLHAAAMSPCRAALAFIASLEGAVELVNLKNAKGKAAVHLCAERGFGLNHVLNLPGVDIEIRDRYDASGLIIAVKEERTEAVQTLLSFRADVNAFAMYAGPRVATPLACAVHVGSQPILQCLLQAAELNIQQPLFLGVPDAPTAKDFARNPRIRSMLEAHIAAQPGTHVADTVDTICKGNSAFVREKPAEIRKHFSLESWWITLLGCLPCSAIGTLSVPPPVAAHPSTKASVPENHVAYYEGLDGL